MLLACFTPVLICFIHTSCTFYAFSGTNLLTRCRSASSCFLLFLCFRKVTQEIFSELENSKTEVPIFIMPKQLTWRESKRGCREATQGLGAAWPWPAPRRRVASLQPIYDSLQVSCFGTVRIGTSVFEFSNSENISCVTFL